MPIPDYQTAMLPLLTACADGEPRRLAEVIDGLANHFQLTPDERAQQLTSGKTLLFYSRIQWAKTYLSQAGLLESAGRGIFRITAEGTKVLADPPTKIDVRYLDQYLSFRAF